MFFRQLDAHSIKVSLSSQEVQKYDFDWVREDAVATEKLYRQLLQLLAEAELRLDFSPKGETLRVEIVPTASGGVQLFFYDEAKSKTLLYETSVFCFSEIGVLLRATAVMLSQYGHRLLHTALYAFAGCWWLVVTPLEGADGAVLRLLEEFAPSCPESTAALALLAESGQLIFPEHAVELLSRPLLP